MINYVTGNEYTGQNAGILMELGYDENDAFVTFKQAIKLDGISGKALKGLTADAKLIRFVKEIDKVTGKEEKKPRYYGVFDIKGVLARRTS
jgi:antirestriction protein ArdC